MTTYTNMVRENDNNVDGSSRTISAGAFDIRTNTHTHPQVDRYIYGIYIVETFTHINANYGKAHSNFKVPICGQIK